MLVGTSVNNAKMRESMRPTPLSETPIMKEANQVVFDEAMVILRRQEIRRKRGRADTVVFRAAQEFVNNEYTK